jgi:hypothetical protein
MAKFIISFARYLYLLPDDSADRITRKLCWINQEFYPVDIIPPWSSMLILPGG